MTNSAINAIIRRAAGRNIAAPAPELERPIGDIVGRGVAGPAAFPRPPASNALVNERLRAGFGIVRNVQLRDGLAIDLDDPFGRR